MNRQPSNQSTSTASADLVQVSTEDHVAQITLRSPPYNYVDPGIMEQLAIAFERLDNDANCRAIVLAAQGKAFCAGANFGPQDGSVQRDPGAFYRQAMRLFRTTKPIVAAVHGAAVGAGVGLALIADFRVASRDARFSVNFNRLGFHPGFGLSETLPRLIGGQHAAMLFYTGRRIDGIRAVEIGLADLLAEPGDELAQAHALAREIAVSAPLAVQNTRATLRRGMADAIAEINRRELASQLVEFATEDFREGVAAMAERRQPQFHGR